MTGNGAISSPKWPLVMLVAASDGNRRCSTRSNLTQGTHVATQTLGPGVHLRNVGSHDALGAGGEPPQSQTKSSAPNERQDSGQPHSRQQSTKSTLRRAPIEIGQLSRPAILDFETKRRFRQPNERPQAFWPGRCRLVSIRGKLTRFAVRFESTVC